MLLAMPAMTDTCSLRVGVVTLPPVPMPGKLPLPLHSILHLEKDTFLTVIHQNECT